MPTVPTYSGPQVREQTLSPVYQREIDVSSGMRALGNTVSALGDALDRIDLRDSQDEAFKAEAQLRSDWQQQRAKLREQYKGDQADQYKTAADEWWKERASALSNELSPRAKALAGKSLGQYKLHVEADTLGYVEGEKTKAREVNYRTLQADLIREAQTSITPENAGAISATTAETIKRNAIAYAAANGFDSEVGQRMAREQLDTFYVTTALSIANRPNGAEAAKAYLAQFGKEMKLADTDRVMDAIDQTAERAKTKATHEMYGNLRLQLLQGGYPSKAQVEQLRVLNPEAAANLQAAMNSERKARAAEAQGKDIKTNVPAYFELRDAVLAEAKGGPAVEILKYADRVSRADLEEVKKMQEKMRNPTEQKKLFTEERTIDTYRPPSLKPTDDKWRALRMEMENALIAARAKKGSDLSDKEMRATLGDFMVEGVVEDAFLWFDTTKPKWQMTKEERQQAKFPSAQQPGDKFTVGQTYKDGAGNRAKYLGNNKWEPVK